MKKYSLTLLLAALLCFSTVTISAAVLYSENFSDGVANNWRELNGTWSVTGGEYVQSAFTVDAWDGIAVVDLNFAPDYVIEVDIKNTYQTGQGFQPALVFGVEDYGANPLHAYSFEYRPTLQKWALLKFNATGPDVTYGQESGTSSPVIGQWYHIKVEVIGLQIKCYVDGVLKIDALVPAIASGPVGLMTDEGVWVFDNFFVLSTASKQVAVDVIPHHCPNILNIKKKGPITAAIMGSADIDVGNIDTASIRLEGVAPNRSKIRDVGTPFEPFIGKTNEYSCNDWGTDGLLDLELRFDAQALVDAIGPASNTEVRVLHLTGEMLDGTPIEGQDVVIIKYKGK